MSVLFLLLFVLFALIILYAVIVTCVFLKHRKSSKKSNKMPTEAYDSESLTMYIDPKEDYLERTLEPQKPIGYQNAFSGSAPVNGYGNQTDGNVQKLYEYKKLLDDGIITQEEFQKLKSEVLNI